MKTLNDKIIETFQMEDPWNGGHSDASNGRVCFCRVYSVNSEERTCSIKTYGTDRVISDADYVDVQWLNLFSSLEGEDSTVIPQINSNGLCIFLDGQPWIIGFFQPITFDNTSEILDPDLIPSTKVAGSAASGKEKLNPGDIIFRSFSRNRFLLRSSGEIEIEAAKICKRTYYPTDSRISEISQNLEITTGGGSMFWVYPDKTKEETLLTKIVKNDFKGSNVLIEESGSILKDSALFYRYRFGSSADFKNTNEARPIILKELYNDGSSFFTIKDPDSKKTTNAYSTSLLPNGEQEKEINDYSYYKKITPDGKSILNINDAFQYEILPTGELKLDVGISPNKKEGLPGEGGIGKFSLNIKPSGDLSLNISDKNLITVKASGEVKIDVGGKSTITIDHSGNIKLTSSAKVEVKAPDVNLLADNIKLGSGASDVVPMGKMLLSAINKFIAIFNSHTHIAPQAPAGALPTQPPLLTTQEITADVLSSTVKVQA